MGQNQFIESLVEVMLSWMRWLTSWFWNIVNSKGTSGGFLRWFSENWISLAVFLIIAGVVIDWLVWMIRWRPYWLWLRKRQIIYEEVPVRKRKRRPAHAPAAPAEDYDDPFAAGGDDPYAQAKPSRAEDDLSEWDSAEDPYARQEDRHTDYDPSIYARPVLGETSKKVEFKRSRPVLGERMKHSNVDDGQ